MTKQLTAADFRSPAILLSGHVDEAMYSSFRKQLEQAPSEGLVIVELSTLGGDPEIARMMGEDIRFHTAMDTGRYFAFLGKAMIYSAGTTFMSFFAKDNRYLTRGTRIMVHERQMHAELKLEGPITSCLSVIKAKLHEIEESINIQNEGFNNLIAGSHVSMEEVLKRAPTNWYIEAQDAASLHLIRAVI
jgi:ATP-dependent protease ClpP protease subunit